MSLRVGQAVVGVLVPSVQPSETSLHIRKAFPGASPNMTTYTYPDWSTLESDINIYRVLREANGGGSAFSAVALERAYVTRYSPDDVPCYSDHSCVLNAFAEREPCSARPARNLAKGA